MKRHTQVARWLAILCSISGLGAAAQAPLTLHQAIQQALGANPEAKLASAESQEARANASLARTQLIPQLNFSKICLAVPPSF